MRIHAAVGHALSASTALAMLAGCSSGGIQSVQPQVAQNRHINNSGLPSTAIVSGLLSAFKKS